RAADAVRRKESAGPGTPHESSARTAPRRRWRSAPGWASGRCRTVRKLVPRSCCVIVIAQQPAQAVAATNAGATTLARRWHNQFIAAALLTSLLAFATRRSSDLVQQTPFAEKNQPVQALLANRAHEPLRVGVGVRRLDGRPDDAHSGSLE